MKHSLTIEQRLAGARKARTRLEQRVLENPRYRGLLARLNKNISQLEELLKMPYKDRETYLRKQREFYYRRKARATDLQRVSGVKGLAHTNPTQNPSKPTVLAPETAAFRPVAPVFQPTVIHTPQNTSITNPTRTGVDLFSLRKPRPKPAKPASADANAAKTAPELFQPFPVGELASQVCPYCHNSGMSSPGTPCSYCSWGRIARSARHRDTCLADWRADLVM